MGFEGNINSHSFSEILNCVCNSNQEGVLTVFDDKRTKIIHFRDTDVTIMGGNQRLKLGDLLIKAGRISPRELENALLEQNQVGALLGEVLINQGLVTEEDIEEVVIRQIEAEICEIFFWENANFTFKEGGLPEEIKSQFDNAVTLNFDVHGALFHIAGQIEAWEELRQKISSFFTIFLPASDNLEIDIPETESEENFATILHTLQDGTNNVNDIIKISQLSLLEVCEIIVILLDQGAICQASLDHLLQVAEEYHNVGKIQKQILFLEQALRFAPADEELLLKIAQAYESTGGGKKVTEYYIMLGNLEFMTNPKKATEYFEKAIVHQPKSPIPIERLLALSEHIEDEKKELYYSKRLASLYTEQGEYDRAKEICTLYLERFSHDLDIRQNLIEIYKVQGDKEALLGEYNFLVLFYEQKNKLPKLLEVLEKMVELTPEDRETQKLIIKVQRKIKWEEKRALVMVSSVLGTILLIGIIFGLYYEFSARNLMFSAKQEERLDIEKSKELYEKIIKSYSYSTVVDTAKNNLRRINIRIEELKQIEKKKAKEKERKTLEKFERIKNFIILNRFIDAKAYLALYRKEFKERRWQKLCNKLEKTIRQKEEKHKNEKIKALIRKAKILEKQGKLKEAREIIDKIEKSEHGEKIQEMKTELEKKNLRSFITKTKMFRKKATKNEKAGFYQLALNAYKTIKEQTEKAMKKSSISKYQYQELTHVYNLAIGGIARIERFENTTKTKWKQAKKLVSIGEHEEAYNIVKEIVLHNDLNKTSAFSSVKIPIRIETEPYGAKIKGYRKTPTTLWIQPKVTSRVIISHHGFKPVKIVLTKDSEYIQKITLKRYHNWQYDTRGPIWGGVSLYGRTVIVTSRSGYISALNAKSGNLIWNYKTKSGWGDIVSSATIFNKRVYFGSNDKKVYSIDLYTGQKYWDYPTKGFVQSTPAVDRDYVFVGTSRGGIYAFKRRIGRKAWFKNERHAVKSQAVIYKNVVIVANSYGYILAFDILKGFVRWKKDLGSAITNNIVLRRNHLFVGTSKGQLFCFDVRRRKIRWKRSLRGAISSSVLIEGKNIFVGTKHGYVYQLYRNNGRKIWETKLPKPIYSKAVKVDNVLYVGCMDSYLYGLDISKDGKMYWKGKFGKKGIRSDLVLSRYSIYIGTEDGVLYSIRK